ncbi:hypothetical protein DASC09_011600 [Saccharomycopsis crataegensis]|uniref:SLM1/RGC1-like BAR-like domain-containing protein n=1 Tax=Saccharomycopsis crataegensis TaxID=43959 RepID=A0AAV5QFW9_9ASCO|nr:hypothetical protein DASC09_011600 [Saccharomycopsis crataegensis]
MANVPSPLAPPLPSRASNGGDQAFATTPFTNQETNLTRKIHDIDEPFPDPSQLLSERLDNWLHCVNILYEYVDTYTTLTKKQIQGYEKIKKSISTLPRFTRYEGHLGGVVDGSGTGAPTLGRTTGSTGSEPEGGSIYVPKGGNRLIGGTRTNTMGSSEIVLDALNGSSTAHSAKEVEVTAAAHDALPSYSDSGSVPDSSAQQKIIENNEFAPHNRGIDGLFEMLRVKNDMNLTSLQNLDQQVKEQILPVFKELIGEVSNYKKKFNSTIEKNNKTLKKIDKSKKKLVGELENSIRQYNENASAPLKSSTGILPADNINYDKDPFLMKKLFFKNLNEQFTMENTLIEQMITLKEEIFGLEIKIVDTIKKLIVLFNNFQINSCEEMINNLSIINQEFSLLDDKFEISKFLSSNVETGAKSSKQEIEQKDEMLLLLSSKLPTDSKLVQMNLKRDIKYIKVDDRKLLGTINHDSTIPILKELITYQEIRKLSLKDRIQKDHMKNDYFALTKLKYLFVFGTENDINSNNGNEKSHDTVVDVDVSDKLLTAVDKDILKGELEPSLVFYLPKCSVIEDIDSDEDNDSASSSSSNNTNSGGLSRSKTLKSRFGSIKRKLKSEKPLKPNEYQIKFVGIDLNHRLLNKFSKSAHKRTIVMKFSTKDQYQVWNSLIREMSGDLQELAEDFDERLDIGAVTSSRGSTPPAQSGLPVAAEEATIKEPSKQEDRALSQDDDEEEEAKDIISNHLNESFTQNTIESKATANKRAETVMSSEHPSDEDFSDAGADSIFELREAIKKDKEKEGGSAKEGATFVEDSQIQ